MTCTVREEGSDQSAHVMYWMVMDNILKYRKTVDIIYRQPLTTPPLFAISHKFSINRSQIRKH